MQDETWQALLRWRRSGMAAAVPDEAIETSTPPFELYSPLCRMGRNRPFAIAHLGQSLDGRIATSAGISRWVTGDADLVHTHRLRALADAVIIGAGTVRHDDPKLTVRRCLGDHPVRVVIDPDRRLGVDYSVFQDGAAPTMLLAAADRVRPGERLGQAEIIGLPRDEAGLSPQDIRAVLAARGLHFLFIEGGGVTISRFLAAAALDRLQLAVAPVLLGSGRASLTLPEIVDLRQGLRPRIRRFTLGEDMLYECIFHE